MDAFKSSLKKINETITGAIKVISPYSKKTSTISPPPNTSNTPNTSTTLKNMFSKITNTIKSEIPTFKNSSVIYNEGPDNTFPKKIDSASTLPERPSVSKYSIDKSIESLNLDEIKTLLSGVKNSVDNILKTTSLTSAMTLASSNKIKKGNTVFNTVICCLILLIIAFLCLNIYTFAKYKKNIFQWISAKLSNNIDDIEPPEYPEENSLEDKETSDDQDDEEDKENKDDTNSIGDSNNSDDYIIDERDRIENEDDNKPKFCYIGNNKNKRSCIKVLNDNECLSKNIFPTMDICINPRLRE